jgi:hypothetical protein
MITENMTLDTAQDAKVWASQLGLQTSEQERNIAAYIWSKKPRMGCAYSEHPLSTLSDEEFWIAAETAPHGLTGKPSNTLGKRTAPPSSTRSLRLPVAVWDALQRKAKAEGVTLNKLACDALTAIGNECRS